MVALTCMSSAQMLQNTGLPAPAVILIVLAMGAVFGLQNYGERTLFKYRYAIRNEI